MVRKNRKFRDTCINFLNKVTDMNIGEKPILKSHAVPSGNFIEEPGERNVLLLGDAAGLGDPLTGEGIYYAHKSAELSARAISDFFNSSKDVNLVKAYKHYLNPVFKELRISKVFRDLAYTRLRYLAYLANSLKVYFELAKIIHGVSSYSNIFKLYIWIKAMLRV
ncbi:MAG: NAD(P)/FAD-dependent oxidoreductase [Candidatus Aminicenantaceae bacterium]